MTVDIPTWVSQHLQQCSLQNGEVRSSLFTAVEKGPRGPCGGGKRSYTEQGNVAAEGQTVFSGAGRAPAASKAGAREAAEGANTAPPPRPRPWMSQLAQEPVMQPRSQSQGGLGGGGYSGLGLGVGGEMEDTST